MAGNTQTNNSLTSQSAAQLLDELLASVTPEEKAETEEKLQRAEARLKVLYSAHPFYAKRAKNRPGYWRRLAASAINVGERPL